MRNQLRTLFSTRCNPDVNGHMPGVHTNWEFHPDNRSQVINMAIQYAELYSQVSLDSSMSSDEALISSVNQKDIEFINAINLYCNITPDEFELLIQVVGQFHDLPDSIEAIDEFLSVHVSSITDINSEDNQDSIDLYIDSKYAFESAMNKLVENEYYPFYKETFKRVVGNTYNEYNDFSEI